MSETPKNGANDLNDTIDGVRERAQQALQNPPQVSDKTKAILVTVAATYVLFRIEKRMVKKVVKKALETTPVRIDLPKYMADLDEWDKIKYANWAAGSPR